MRHYIRIGSCFMVTHGDPNRFQSSEPDNIRPKPNVSAIFIFQNDTCINKIPKTTTSFKSKFNLVQLCILGFSSIPVTGYQI